MIVTQITCELICYINNEMNSNKFIKLMKILEVKTILLYMASVYYIDFIFYSLASTFFTLYSINSDN